MLIAWFIFVTLWLDSVRPLLQIPPFNSPYSPSSSHWFQCQPSLLLGSFSILLYLRFPMISSVLCFYCHKFIAGNMLICFVFITGFNWCYSLRFLALISFWVWSVARNPTWGDFIFIFSLNFDWEGWVW